MNTYQAMFIFPASVKDERVAELAETIRTEISKLQGTIRQTSPVDKRTFARPLRKTEAGQYLKLVFSMDPQGMAPLQARLKLVDEIFRVQIVQLDEQEAGRVQKSGEPAAPARAAGEGETHA